MQNRDDLVNLETGTQNYLKALLIHLKKRKDQTNPFFVPESSLNQVNDCLINISANIPYSASDAIASYVDQAFNVLATTWPAMDGPRVVDISTATFEILMGDITQQIKKAHDAVDVVTETKEAYSAEIEKLEIDITNYRGTASEKIEEIVSGAKESAQQLNAQLEQNIADANTKADASRNETEARYITELTEIEDQAQNLLDKVSNKASVISGKVIADSYGNYARNKAIYKVIYDVLAVVFAIAGIFLVGYALVGMHADETSATVYKTAVSIASFTISGFLFKRGTYEQREAKAAKRTELTLRQYESFIANLDELEKDRITKEIADRIFIKGEIDDNVPTVSESIMQRKASNPEMKDLIELIQLVMKQNVKNNPTVE